MFPIAAAPFVVVGCIVFCTRNQSVKQATGSVEQDSFLFKPKFKESKVFFLLDHMPPRDKRNEQVSIKNECKSPTNAPAFWKLEQVVVWCGESDDIKTNQGSIGHKKHLMSVLQRTRPHNRRSNDFSNAIVAKSPFLWTHTQFFSFS
jgi:hypothetical protein